VAPSFWDDTKSFLTDHSDRAVQDQLFEGVLNRLSDGEHLVPMEGGPGCGKSLIVAPLLRVNNERPGNSRVIISAFTKAQQDVLFNETAPRVKNLTPRGAVMLKGRNNYICLRRAALMKIKTEIREDGSRPNYPELADQWHLICSDDEYDCSADSCGGDDAYYLAKAAAETASLVITNHKILALNHKLEGLVLGDTSGDLLVVDEGHLMEGVLQDTFGGLMSVKKLENADNKVAPWGCDLRPMIGYVEQVFARIGEDIAQAEADKRKKKGVVEARLWKDWAVGDVIVEHLGAARGTILTLLNEELDSDFPDKEKTKLLRKAARRLDGLLETAVYMADRSEDHGVFATVSSRQVSIEVKKFDVYDEFQEMARKCYRRTVVMSATLNQLAKDRLKLGPLIVAGEPFDSERNRLAYCVAPDPDAISANEWSEDRLLELVAASRGGAMVVASAHTQKVRAAEVLRAAGWRVGEQTAGSESIKGLVRGLQAGRIDVIVGVDSVGTGIDIPGQALRLVVLLSPFNPNPFSDPFLTLWGDRFGGRAWPMLFFKMADEKMDQSIGRLLRGPADRGVVAFLEPRGKQQGRFLRWVAPSRVTGDITDVKEFFNE
jgi:Rad3-related DNA helicase